MAPKQSVPFAIASASKSSSQVKAERRPLDLRAALALDTAAEEARSSVCTRRAQLSAALAAFAMPSVALAADDTQWTSRKSACGFRSCEL